MLCGLHTPRYNKVMENWQDIVLAAGALVLALGLIPSVISSDKPALTTSVMTGSVLAAYTVTYASLSLWYASAMTAAATALWFVLAVQKARRRNTKPNPDK